MIVSTPNTSPSVGPISVSALDSLEEARHRWYFFKEGFSPILVQRAIEATGCGSKDLIVDPFCGSGTVPLQAALDGHISDGVEVNPFLSFVSRTKLQQCDPRILEKATEVAVKAAMRGRVSPLVGFSTFTKKNNVSKWLFNDDVLSAFEGAWHSVESSCAKGAPQNLMKLCLIGAAMDTCNAVKDGKCLRYRTNWIEHPFTGLDFLTALSARIRVIVEDLREAPLYASAACIRKGDARRGEIGRVPFRLCITSPPYLNSFDYTDVYRPELFLGRWITTMKQLRALRLRTVRSHVQVSWSLPKSDDFGVIYSRSIEALRSESKELWDSRIPRMVQAYFEDMRMVLASLRRHAARNATAWIVVSTSAYGGVEIPVDLIIAEIATRTSWNLREVSVLRYLRRLSGQQWSDLAENNTRGPHLRESVIILDAAPESKAMGPKSCSFSKRAKDPPMKSQKVTRGYNHRDIEQTIAELRKQRRRLDSAISSLRMLSDRGLPATASGA